MATFNFTFDPGTTVQQMVGFEMAGRVWSRYLSDAVTINLHAGMSSSLPTNVIGGALPGFQAERAYTTVRDRLYADATSADDTAATNGMRNYKGLVDQDTHNYGTVDFFVDDSLTWFDGTAASTWNSWLPDADRLSYGGKTYVDLKTYSANDHMALTRANAKALGVSLDQAGNTVLDGYVMLSDLSNFTNVAWNYDYTRSSAAGSNSLDFFSVALHEIGHTLGFVSSVDRPGWLNPFFTSTTGVLDTTWVMDALMSYWGNGVARTKFATPLDFFRYTQTTTPEWGGWRDFSVGGKTMFSFDGTTAIANFATGLETSFGGSGFQASHWQGTTGSSGIMNPTLGLGVRREISTLDLRGMDAIGWNLTNNSNAVQNIDLSALRTQSIQSLEARNRNSTRVTTATNALNWYNINLTQSLTPLVSDRDQEINTMLTNSQIYDLTRIISSGSTGTVSRQVFASMFQQQQGFRSELWEVAPVEIESVAVAITGLGADVSRVTVPELSAVVGSASEAALRIAPVRLRAEVSFSNDGANVEFVGLPSPEWMPLTGMVAVNLTPTSSPVQQPLSSVDFDTRAYDSQLPMGKSILMVNPEQPAEPMLDSLDFSSDIAQEMAVR